MSTQYDRERADRNEDPITGEPGSHPVGVGVGTAGGVVTGAAVGAIGGPVGSLIGAVVGGIAGAAAGKSIAEGINPTEDAYWRENHSSQSWADKGYSYDDYEPAYRMGYNGQGRDKKGWDDAEDKLESEWEETKGDSRLTWEKAKEATRAGWHGVERALPGDADGDGR